MDNSILPVMDVNGGGMGGNCFMYIFGLIILLGLFNGGFGMNGNNGLSSQMQNGFDNQNSMANQREILTAVSNGTAQGVATTNQTFHDTLGIIQNRYDELARDISGIAVGQANALANQNECCCTLRSQLQQNNYDSAMRDAQTNANLTAQIQGVKDMIAQNKIEALQAQVSQLQLAQATSGMLKFPNSWTYGAGYFPPVFGGCGCQNV